MGSVDVSREGVIRLQDVIERIGDYDEDLTIYVAPEWTPHSSAMLALEPANGGLPAQAKGAGMTYFLEVFVAKEVLESIKELDLLATTNRVIHYAINDA